MVVAAAEAKKAAAAAAAEATSAKRAKKTEKAEKATSAKRAKKAAAPTSEEALQQAQAEGLVLRVAETNTGYWCVYKQGPYYLARMKKARLGSYATAEAAALAVARFGVQ